VPIISVSDQYDPALLLFEKDGNLYDTSPSREVKNIPSFKDLGIQTIDGNNNYSPELAWIDSICGDKICVIDKKLNSHDNTQHIVKYDRTYHSSTKNGFTLDDVIIQIDNKKACHFAVSESRIYDAGYGGYPLTFYIIDEQGLVLEFDIQNYKNKIFASPQSLIWKNSGLSHKEGFVRLIENSYYWGNKEELIYAFGLDNNNSSFFLDLVNIDSLQPNHAYTPITHVQNSIKLDFNSHVDFSLKHLPKFDSASCLDDKEFLISMIPLVNGNLNSFYRDIYWFRLQSGKDEAILLADPYRVSNIDRFDGVKNCESPVWIKHIKEQPTLEDMIYLVTGQNEIKKFKIDLTP
jgi:hypothetical protein